MKIDPNELIAGVRPATLKQLFRRREITLITAMKSLSLDRMAAATTLAKLEAEGWLARDGDWWEPTDLAMRLLATKLIPRRSLAAAKAAIERLVAEAEAINSDPEHPVWVEAILIFGSVLTAGPDDTVGDVDAAVQLRRRPDSDDLWAAEIAAAPSSLRGVELQFWPVERVNRRLRRVDRCISLHPTDEALSFPHIEVFRRGAD